MLSDREFQILDHIQKHPDATANSIIAIFGPATAPRIHHLLSLDSINYDGVWNDDGIFVESGRYTVTDTGYMLLEDYLHQHRLQKKAKWEDRAWKLAPIVISVLALIMATISLAQALHWIDLAR